MTAADSPADTAADVAPNLEVVLEDCTFLECPRWHDGRMFVSDFYTGRVLAFAPGGAAETVAEVPNQPSGLGWLPDGRLLVVSMKDRRLLRQEPSGELVEHADLSGLAAWHLNDMVVDAHGRAYVGNFGYDLMAGGAMQPAAVLRVDPDGSASVAAQGLQFPNGSVLTSDGATLVVAESFGGRLSAFDVAADGSLSGRRDWAAFGADADDPAAVTPDGICLDAEGAIWVADAGHHRAIRVREGGEILAEVHAGDLDVFACMLGGEDGRTLYLCAAPSYLESERRTTRDGVLLAVPVDVPHAGLP